MHEFTIWAPLAKAMAVKIGATSYPMIGPNATGWWSAKVEEADPGTDYGFLLNDDATPYPDPRGLWQPMGVHAPSRVYDHAAFQWSDARWQGPPLTGAVIYEMHVGTFTTEGTFDAAIQRLDYLFQLGVTHLEVMPVAAFPGEHGWGYDGVALFAVQDGYGGPDGLKRFVDACHAHGLAVLIDVVYNHFGPVGNYTNKFGSYLTDRHRTPWGEAVNFEEAGSDQVRRFFCDNALMWMRDYHADGLRLDAARHPSASGVAKQKALVDLQFVPSQIKLGLWHYLTFSPILTRVYIRSLSLWRKSTSASARWSPICWRPCTRPKA